MGAKASEITAKWFKAWESGDYRSIPVTEDFRHTSPYGTIVGKQPYLDLVSANEEKFLGHSFEFHDELYGDKSACVRYTARRKDFSLEVSEWYEFEGNLIKEIISYYNIEGEGEIDNY